MPKPFAVLFALFCVCGAMFDAAHAAPLPALDQDTRAQWKAVGLVNTAGFRDKASCTGTLIAPDLVLTAAHCVGPISDRNRTRHFVAGWDRGSFAAHRMSAEIIRHPKYASAEGNDRFHYDIALIRLGQPIKNAEINPLALTASVSPEVGRAAILGYHRQRPHVINGRFDCPADVDGGPRILVLGCEVISGNSGGPVLIPQKDGGWVVVGVVAGRISGPSPQALAVPIGAWVMTHWHDAMMRAEVETHAH